MHTRPLRDQHARSMKPLISTPPELRAHVSCSLLRRFHVPSQDGETLRFAVMKNNVAAMKRLLAHGVDLNAKDGVRASLASFLTGGKERGRKGAALHEGLS